MSTQRPKIDWKVITNLPVQSRRDAMRWTIEMFHKVLKSDAEQKHRSFEPQRGLST